MSLKPIKHFYIAIFGSKVVRKQGKIRSLMFEKQWEKEFTSKKEALEFASRNSKIYKDFEHLDNIQSIVLEYIPEPKPQIQKMRSRIFKKGIAWLEEHWQEVEQNAVTQQSIKAFGLESKQTIGVVIALVKRFCKPIKDYLATLETHQKQLADKLLEEETLKLLTRIQEDKKHQDAAGNNQ